MTGESEHPRTSVEAANAVAAQVREVRDVLRTDAAAAGIDIARELIGRGDDAGVH